MVAASNEPDGNDFGLRGQSPDSVHVVKEALVCERARRAYNGRAGTVRPPSSQIVWVVMVGSSRYVVASADDPSQHWRDWCVYDLAFEERACIVS
jgi:hypothetical protein